MDIKNIIGAHESKRLAQEDERRRLRQEKIEARKKNITANAAWVQKMLLPVLERVSQQLNEAGYPTQILQRKAADEMHGDQDEEYLVGVEFRVSKQKGGSPNPNIKYTWGFEGPFLHTELRHNTSMPPGRPEEVPMSRIAESDLEAVIERFLKLVYDGRA